MVRSRFIPVLLLDGTGLIKTKQFKRYKYLGDIINALKIFNEKQVDELCIFDLSSSISGGPNFRLLENVARQANMPLCYGGGISSVDQAKRLISIGFEKISLSQMSYSHSELIKEISDAVGDKLEIILDGGVRRGTHVLKAIAAGATACSFGKMFLFSLAAGGQQGVEHLLQNMHDEINRNMVLMGCKNLKELNSSKLIYRK